MKSLIITQSITGNLGRSMDRYFNDVSKIKLLSIGEELILARKIKEGDEAALLRLVNTNLRFVISVAKQYQNQGVDIGDLINEGNMGLIRAAKRFDETKGFKFISYAVWWIRQSIIFAIAEQSRIIHLPYNYISLMSKFHKASQRLEQTLKRAPSTEEIAEYLEMPAEKLRDMLSLNCQEISLDKPLSRHVEVTHLDVIPNTESHTDENLMRDSLKDVLQNSLVILTHRDREVIRLYFGLNLAIPVPLEHIAEKLNLSVEHTRRLKDTALERIKKSAYGSLLAPYLA